MATATVEERQLLQTLRWWDGFTIALCNPGFLLGSLGFSLGALGVLGAMTLWGISAAIGLCQNWIYSEPATMFPRQSGGIALYANEAWRKYTTLVGPIATFGYWIGWSVVLSIFGKIIGDLVVARWFPSEAANTWFSIGSVHFGLPHAIAIGCIVGVWLFNVLGIKPFVWLTYVTGGLLMIPLFVFIVLPYLTGNWHSSNVHWAFADHQWGGLKLAFVYLFLMAWSAYGIEICATFTPEYKSRRDAAIALRSAATFSLLVFILLPLGLGGVTGAPSADTAEGQFYVQAFQTITNHTIASILLIMLIASLILSMSSSTADAGRALFGISRSGLTIKQFGVLNRFHVPGRAMTLDLVVNVALVLFISSNLAILYMSNIGYVLCHVFALSGFLLLRRDRPNWPRPVRVGAAWVFMAGFLCAANFVFLVVGAGSPKLNGYGTWTDFAIGVGILIASVLLFFFRRLVQDREPVHFSEQTPTMPDEADMLPPVSAPVAPAAS
ncbi:MAG TPA: APC family permease [Solirubrobacteraceae bacterium]|nr:APC family permease [Solirubrobacteraceae bacterium]